MRTRLVEPDDAGALCAIYNVEVAEPSVTFDLLERTYDEQLEWVEAHRGAYPAIVAIGDDPSRGAVGARGETVVGFASLSAFRERPAYATSVEDSVYVHRNSRGRGVGPRAPRGPARRSA